MNRCPATLALLFSLVAATAGTAAESGPRLDVVTIAGRTLADNPLHDPAQRHAAVFLPGQHDGEKACPVIYYLPGFGSSAEDFIAQPADWLAFVQQLAAENQPFVFVVVDGRTRWGGSQYLDSPAQGNYATYVCDEIVPTIEKTYHIARTPVGRIIAGHSSGGFGALRLGMLRPDLFATIIALSPDSDFPTTHLPLVQLAAVRATTPAQVDAWCASDDLTHLDGDVGYAIALSAAYAPRGPETPGQFAWIWDAGGHFQDEVWKRWLANDPLTIVTERPDAFAPQQQIYLDGAALDEFKANIGARKIYDVLAPRQSRCTFDEPPGHHGDHLMQRMARGLAWACHQPMTDIARDP